MNDELQAIINTIKANNKKLADACGEKADKLKARLERLEQRRSDFLAEIDAEIDQLKRGVIQNLQDIINNPSRYFSRGAGFAFDPSYNQAVHNTRATLSQVQGLLATLERHRRRADADSLAKPHSILKVIEKKIMDFRNNESLKEAQDAILIHTGSTISRIRAGAKSTIRQPSLKEENNEEAAAVLNDVLDKAYKAHANLVSELEEIEKDLELATQHFDEMQATQDRLAQLASQASRIVTP